MALRTQHYLLRAVRWPYATEFLIEIAGNGRERANKYQVSTRGPSVGGDEVSPESPSWASSTPAWSAFSI